MKKERLFWDIETEALPMADLQKVMPEFTAASNIKDPIKIQASIDEKKADWIEKAALKAITGKVVAVTFAWDSDEPEMVAGDEKEIICGILGKLNEAISIGKYAYAWNGHGFDLPFIAQRATIHGLLGFFNLTQKRGARFNWNENLIDPKLVWSNYSPDHTGTSLDTVSKTLGMSGKNGNGKDFAALLKINPEQAESYAKNDIVQLRGIVMKMGI